MIERLVHRVAAADGHQICPTIGSGRKQSVLALTAFQPAAQLAPHKHIPSPPCPPPYGCHDPQIRSVANSRAAHAVLGATRQRCSRCRDDRRAVCVTSGGCRPRRDGLGGDGWVRANSLPKGPCHRQFPIMPPSLCAVIIAFSLSFQNDLIDYFLFEQAQVGFSPRQITPCQFKTSRRCSCALDRCPVRLRIKISQGAAAHCRVSRPDQTAGRTSGTKLDQVPLLPYALHVRHRMLDRYSSP